MTATTEAALNPCACGCGELVRGTWKRGHKLRHDNGKLTALPGPDDDLDAGEAEPEPEPEPVPLADDDLDIPDWLRRGEMPPPGPEPEPDEVPADRPPGHLRSPRAGRGARPGAAPKRPPNVTVRRDIQAKIRLILKPAAEIWAVRDQMCGPVAVVQEPLISEALAEIVCDSPDLIAFFTGPAGGFMKYIKLFLAVQPVAMVAWAHHVGHAQVVLPEGAAQQPPQMPAYAA
jgi:hypothetical protein